MTRTILKRHIITRTRPNQFRLFLICELRIFLGESDITVCIIFAGNTSSFPISPSFSFFPVALLVFLGGG